MIRNFTKWVLIFCRRKSEETSVQTQVNKTNLLFFLSCHYFHERNEKQLNTHKKNSIWWWEKCYNNGLLLLKYYILLLQQLNLDERNRKHWKKKICSLYLHRLCALPIDFWETLKKRNTHNILERMMNRNISWNKNWTSLTIKLKKRTKKILLQLQVLLLNEFNFGDVQTKVW